MVPIAWSSPPTFSAGQALTFSHMNALRDNLNETAVAKASTAGSHFAATGVNTLAQRTSAASLVSGAQTETNTSYTNLATVGPTVTVTLTAMAWVSLYCSSFNSTGAASVMGVDLSGANTVAADDIRSIVTRDTGSIRQGAMFLFTGLTAGSTTFTAKYRVTGGTGTWDDRRAAVMPL